MSKFVQARNGGKRVGIIGIGGLGQMGVRLAKAMGRCGWLRPWVGAAGQGHE